MMNEPAGFSNLFAKVITEFTKLPGIGKKTAIRLALHLINAQEEDVLSFSNAITQMKLNLKQCTVCHNISDTEVCAICSNPGRNRKQICVVENIRDIISIESTGQFNGVYHTLGGLIAPLEGIGPDQLFIKSLIDRCDNGQIEEVIMALSANIEGDTTVYYIAKQLQHISTLKITGIARGVAFGSELEYIDEYTLGKAFLKRLPLENYINSNV